MTSTSQQLAHDQPRSDDGWTTVITPRQGWFDWRLGQLWAYRDLVALFVWRDFTAVYKQTILGPAWHIVQPLLTTLTYTVVFSMVARLPTDGVPPFLFYLAGTVAWIYFSTTLTLTSTAFVMNANLLGKVYFPRLALPVSIVCSNLITFAIQFGILLAVIGIYIWFGTTIQPTSWVLLLPVLVAMLAGYALGGGIIVSALTVRYRDLAKVVAFGVQLGMFLTPVVYPLSMVDDRMRLIVEANPLTPIFEGFRLALLGVGTVAGGDLVVSGAVMVLVLAIGLTLFSHIERTLMDTV